MSTCTDARSSRPSCRSAGRTKFGTTAGPIVNYLEAVANTDGLVLGVVGAKAGIWLRNLPTGKAAHSVAADPRNGKVFVPITATQKVKGCSRGCVEVFGWK